MNLWISIRPSRNRRFEIRSACRRDTAEPVWCPDGPLSGCNSYYSGKMIIFVFVKSEILHTKTYET